MRDDFFMDSKDEMHWYCEASWHPLRIGMTLFTFDIFDTVPQGDHSYAYQTCILQYRSVATIALRSTCSCYNTCNFFRIDKIILNSNLCNKHRYSILEKGWGVPTFWKINKLYFLKLGALKTKTMLDQCK